MTVPVFHACKTTTVTVRNLTTASFAAILVAYGVVHGIYIAIAASTVALWNPETASID